MENLGEALKMGFAIAFFVMALSLSMSSFSQANRAVNAVITARDRDKLLEDATLEEIKDAGYEQYVYVEPVSSDNLTRTVGIETVVSTINRAINENLKFLKLEVLDVDNHDIHIDEHTKFIITDTANSIDDDFKNNLLEHIKQHQLLNT